MGCKTKNKKSFEKTELATSSYKSLMLKQLKNPTIQSFEIEELVHQLNIRIGTKDKKFDYLKQYLTSLIEKKQTNLDFISLDKVSKISIKTKEFIDYENYRSKKNSIKKFKIEFQSLDSIFSKWTSLTGRF